MNHILRILTTIGLAAISSGCASGGTSNTPIATTTQIKNSVSLNEPIEVVWRKLVAGISKSFFVINNMDKDSGFLNLSYTGDPEKYVDGGEIYTWVKDAKGKREYRFPASHAFVQYESFETGMIHKVSRKLDLDGRINITVQENGSGKCIVSVNVKYLITKSGSMQHLVIMQNYQTQWVSSPYSSTTSFTTGSTGYFPETPQIVYKATGRLEEEILGLLN